MTKPRLSFWQIWNMSFGFMGIQFGWGLQMANMSSIYEYLGAKESELSILWIAAPLTGLLVQPIVGHLSDRTWNSLGRRKPYFLTGALLSTLALLAMPNSGVLWMAVGLLWILDASINITMEPFRAFVADMLPEDQRPLGYSVQTLLIGLGAVISSALPWILINGFGVTAGPAGPGKIPLPVKLAFYIGSAVLFVAVMATILSTKEYPPEDLEAFRRMKAEKSGLAKNAAELLAAIGAMPQRMRQLAWVQVFTWAGLFCMWTYFGPSIARTVFGAVDATSPTYAQGTAWGGLCFSWYNGTALVFSFVLIALARKVSPKTIHTFGLLCGAVGLMSVLLVKDQYLLLASMTGVGIAWACILSMPYAMLAGALPAEKMGTYMGVFNFFIVIPQVIVSLGSGRVVTHVFHNHIVNAVFAGGVFLLLAALVLQRVKLEAHELAPPSGKPACAS
jgi:maltose/moltooligosaccharide transporter